VPFIFSNQSGLCAVGDYGNCRFGSILRSHSRADSDIHVLLHFAPQAQQGLLTLARIKHELEASTKKRVDIAIKESIVNSENPIRRDEILKTARIIYAQR
jgi:predicted nucleotidyltransferase